jgi:plastocyanin
VLKRRFFQVLPSIMISVAIFACGGGEDATPTTQGAPSPPPPPPPPAAPAAGDVRPPASAASGQPSEGEVTLVSVINGDPAGPTGEYKFSPLEFTFKVGETVSFSIKAETELHNFSVDELNIDQDINTGETVELKFTFNDTGTYRLYCLFHEANGMVGTITVVQ